MTHVPDDAVKIPGSRSAFATRSGEVYSTSFQGTVRMRPALNSDGYLQIKIVSETGERKALLLHRVLALLFVDGDTSLTVDHGDGNRVNNDLSNLEWVTKTENTRRALARSENWKEKISRAQSIPVQGLCVRTGVECRYPSVLAAATAVRGTKINYKYKSEPNGSHISRSIKSGRVAYGHKWRYAL